MWSGSGQQLHQSIPWPTSKDIFKQTGWGKHQSYNHRSTTIIMCTKFCWLAQAQSALQTVQQYSGITWSLCSWSATTRTMSMLLEYQAFTPRIPLAVGPPLVTDPDWVSNMLVSFPGLEYGSRVRHLNHDITGRLFKLTTRSKYEHVVVGWYF